VSPFDWGEHRQIHHRVKQRTVLSVNNNKTANLYLKKTGAVVERISMLVIIVLMTTDKGQRSKGQKLTLVSWQSSSSSSSSSFICS